MEAFVKHTGIAAPLPRADVDTDQIIPKQFLKRIVRKGYDDGLFFDWRFHPDGTPDREFELNAPQYQNASILLTGRNFGCGSSREHAPWALMDYGFRVVIAPSFADIFYNNCLQNGLLPVVLPDDQVNALIEKSQKISGYQLTVDLQENRVSDNQGFSASFDLNEFRRYCLLNGLDDIGLTMQHEDEISAFEATRPDFFPRIASAQL